MSPKDIAEKILNCKTYDIPDIQTLARAYLELEKELTFRKDAEIPVYKEEITKLKEEISGLSVYCGEVRVWQNRAEDLSEENNKLKEDNLKLEEQVFKDTEYIGYIQDQLELSKSVLLQKTLEIDNLNASIKSFKRVCRLINT